MESMDLGSGPGVDLGADLGADLGPPDEPVGSPRLTLLAGGLGGPGNLEGIGAAARFDSPGDVEYDGAGNLYVADFGNGTIRKLSLRPAR